MKTLFSPSQLLESGRALRLRGLCSEMLDTPTTISASAQQAPPSAGDCGGGAYSLCEVCNLQLTSAAQAQLHYTARSHLRRVRQLRSGQTRPQAAGPLAHRPAGSGRGPACGSLRGLPGAGGLSVMMKPFLSLPAETTSPSGLFSSFNMMDPVQKAVISHTFGVNVVPKKKQLISCHVCQLRFNSDSQAEAHYRGSRHAKRLKSQQHKAQLPVTGQTNGSSSSPPGPAPPVSADSSDLLFHISDSSSLLKDVLLSSSSSSPSSTAGSEPPPAPGPTSSSSTPSGCEKSEDEAKKLLYCCLCKVAVNSVSQLEAHNAGSKHKTMQDARSGAGPIKAYPRLGAKLKHGSGGSSSGLQNKTFYCQICNVHVNSEVQLKQHISSRRHKDKVAGKPPKPKYSPYSKQPTKELVKSSFLPSAFGLSSFLTSPLSSSLLSSLSLHPRSPSSLYPASFLRQAPGPIRTSQGSVLFTPY